ncbi:MULTISPECIES: hypothetical protein [unclassified Streptomyces]|uniref:hypothetical protein n=1 Tax=unclassified Streptomyces TaxID=2593676 RepID=UPI003658155F
MDLLTPAAFAPRAVRQLRRIRAAYACGFVLWAAGAAWEGWHRPGSRHMWMLLLFLALFSGLLGLTALSLSRLRKAARGAPAASLARRTAGRPTDA